VLVNGQQIDRWPAERRARTGVARSFQSLELFEDLTVRENLLAAADSRDRRAYLSNLVWPGRQTLGPAVWAAIDRFELGDDLDRVARDLPFGRRRLVGMARAIATGASVLLLDEPGAGLSASERNELVAAIRHAATQWGVGVLLVEHDVSLVMRSCDRVVVLDFGQKLAEGRPAEVRNDPRVIAAYLGDVSETGSQAAAVTVPR
jgi:sulfate-transporting ATPase